MRPGVFKRIHSIYRANEVLWQAFFFLVSGKGIERRGGENAPEIPDYCFERLFHAAALAFLKSSFKP
jgi:hypothetical protein